MYSARDAHTKAKSPWTKDQELSSLLENIEGGIKHVAATGKFEHSAFLTRSQFDLTDRLKAKLEDAGYAVQIARMPDWAQVTIKWGVL